MGPGRATPGRVARGTIVLVRFPFTDLTGSKRRPALVVSARGFHDEDLVVCAISSQLPARPRAWDVTLEVSDVVEVSLPKPSVVLVGKLFTIHAGLIAGLFGQVTPAKLTEVLQRLRQLFSGNE